MRHPSLLETDSPMPLQCFLFFVLISPIIWQRILFCASRKPSELIGFVPLFGGRRVLNRPIRLVWSELLKTVSAFKIARTWKIVYWATGSPGSWWSASSHVIMNSFPFHFLSQKPILLFGRKDAAWVLELDLQGCLVEEMHREYYNLHFLQPRTALCDALRREITSTSRASFEQVILHLLHDTA